MIDMSLYIPTHTGGNSGCLAMLESSIVSIQSECNSMQSDHKKLRNEFQKVINDVLKHSKEIQAMQGEVRRLTSTMQEIYNAILPNAPLLPPCSPFAALRINDDLASLQSVTMLNMAPSSPAFKKVNRGG
jgi:Mg2+ and Co2+ transporter CorA